MSVTLLTEHHLESLSLNGGCTGSSLSTLVKKPHCWKSHAAAYLSVILNVVCCVSSAGPFKSSLKQTGCTHAGLTALLGAG